MFNHNDTINSTQNSTINITQLMTSTTTNRRSRFVNPGQALPVPEDEDIYVSLQVLQAQLKSQVSSSGTQELLGRVLGKVDKLQTSVDRISGSHKIQQRPDDDAARIERKELESKLADKDAQLEAVQAEHDGALQDIVTLRNDLAATRNEFAERHQKDMSDLRLQFEGLRAQVERHDAFQAQIVDLQGKVVQLETVQREKLLLEDKYKIEQMQNNELLRRNWFLESENNRLRKAISEPIEEYVEVENQKQNPDYDTVLLPLEGDDVASIRAILEQEQREKIGHASRV